FFHCHPPHRALPSFPTRRSSDLRSIQTHRHPAIWPVKQRLQTPVSATTANSNRPPWPGCDRFRLERLSGIRNSSQDFCTAPANLDRKSTRLNSSHVKISYAVFCL